MEWVANKGRDTLVHYMLLQQMLLIKIIQTLVYLSTIAYLYHFSISTVNSQYPHVILQYNMSPIKLKYLFE